MSNFSHFYKFNKRRGEERKGKCMQIKWKLQEEMLKPETKCNSIKSRKSLSVIYTLDTQDTLKWLVNCVWKKISSEWNERERERERKKEKREKKEHDGTNVTASRVEVNANLKHSIQLLWIIMNFNCQMCMVIFLNEKRRVRAKVREREQKRLTDESILTVK